MNHREEPHLPAGARRALYAMALLLVPALGPEQGHAGPRQGSLYPRAAEPMPYLPVIGFPALRFAEAPPPPDLTPRAAPVVPPVPASSAIEAAVASANGTTDPNASLPATHESAPTPNPGPAANDTVTTASAPAPILPDTVHSIVHPEDFLPYFELPGSTHQPDNVTVIVPGVPAPAPPPAASPSSATYTQSPR